MFDHVLNQWKACAEHDGLVDSFASQPEPGRAFADTLVAMRRNVEQRMPWVSIEIDNRLRDPNLPDWIETPPSQQGIDDLTVAVADKTEFDQLTILIEADNEECL